MPAPALRAIVKTRMDQLGLSQAELGRRMASRWGCDPKSAEMRLYRWQHRKREMTTDALADLLDELGLAVMSRDA